MKLVAPHNRRKFKVLVVGIGAGRRRRRRHARRLGYDVKVFTYHDSPRRAHTHRRPGRHQRRQELQERRRLDLPALLRHGEGRRLPRAGGQRLPAGGGLGRHHRPVRRPGRALRPGVRRPARQPHLRRRPGVAHVLRPGQTGQQLLLGAYQALCGRSGRHRHPVHDRTEMLDLVVEGARRRHRHPQPPHRGDRATRRRRHPRHRRLRQRLLSCPPTPRRATSPPYLARTSRAPCSPTRASPRSTRRASRPATTSSRSSR